MQPSDLDARLLAAHAAGDRPALIDLYLEASDTAQTEEAANFYLTHAYVFALDVGDPRADMFKQRLVDGKCEALH
ncbi:hypothetical protein N9M66_06435 [Litoreibacter sp.]|nr:hypothetical protein [Litoreibacter sp.]